MGPTTVTIGVHGVGQISDAGIHTDISIQPATAPAARPAESARWRRSGGLLTWLAIAQPAGCRRRCQSAPDGRRWRPAALADFHQLGHAQFFEFVGGAHPRPPMARPAGGSAPPARRRRCRPDESMFVAAQRHAVAGQQAGQVSSTNSPGWCASPSFSRRAAASVRPGQVGTLIDQRRAAPAQNGASQNDKLGDKVSTVSYWPSRSRRSSARRPARLRTPAPAAPDGAGLAAGR